jgi:hypothetical protein
MRRADSINPPPFGSRRITAHAKPGHQPNAGNLRRRNIRGSAKSAASAGTRHGGASAAKAALIMPPYVAAKTVPIEFKHFADREVRWRGSRAMRHFIRLQRQVRLGCYRRASSARTLLASGFQLSQNGDSGLAQNALDHVVGQARCVVVKMEEIFFLVIAEFLKAVSVGELTQRAKVLRLESFLQFVGGSH